MEPREIYRSLIRLYILAGAARESISAAGFTEKLGERGLTVSRRSTQRVLSEFEAKGYLASRDVRNGRAGRMYAITKAGQRQLVDARRRIRSLIEIFDSNRGA